MTNWVEQYSFRRIRIIYTWGEKEIDVLRTFVKLRYFDEAFLVLNMVTHKATLQNLF